jgi:hypothetical protein
METFLPLWLFTSVQLKTVCQGLLEQCVPHPSIQTQNLRVQVCFPKWWDTAFKPANQPTNKDRIQALCFSNLFSASNLHEPLCLDLSQGILT